VAVASAGPYASLHCIPDTQPRQHPNSQFFTGRMPFMPPNQQRQSTEDATTTPLSKQKLLISSQHAGFMQPPFTTIIQANLH